MTTVDTKLMTLLNQYAQESGFENLAQMKQQYHPNTYSLSIAGFIRRARYEMTVKDAAP